MEELKRAFEVATTELQTAKAAAAKVDGKVDLSRNIPEIRHATSYILTINLTYHLTGLVVP